MNRGIYCIDGGSIFVELVRLRHRCADYEKWWVRYYLRPSMTYIDQERSVKIYPSNTKHWKRIDECQVLTRPHDAIHGGVCEL